MEHVWRKIDELRAEYESLREDRTPIDVFTFFEVDLGLNPIPFDDLTSKLRDKFAERIAPRFGVNSQVIGIRLDRDGVWPAA